jgi:hypothetical protein
VFTAARVAGDVVRSRRATTSTLAGQLQRVPRDASRLIGAIGGNDALANIDLLSIKMSSSAETLAPFARRPHSVRGGSRNAVGEVIERQLTTMICTIYTGALAGDEAAREDALMSHDCQVIAGTVSVVGSRPSRVWAASSNGSEVPRCETSIVSPGRGCAVDSCVAALERCSVSQQKPKDTVWSHYGFVSVTAGLFVASLAGHWAFAWYAFVEEQAQHAQAPEVSAFIIQAARDTLENWQSEFLQLIWQVAGLALLYHIGSPQSKEGNDRLEEKVDLILQAVDDNAKKEIARLDRLYHRD